MTTVYLGPKASLMQIRVLFAACCFCLTILSNRAGAQTTDIIPDDGIQNELHRAHAGEVSFMADSIPLGQYSEKDMLSQFTPGPGSDLYIRVFLAHSLTNYQHAMAPGLDLATLNRHGNFQLSFLIDGKLIYAEKLHWNSGGARLKNQNTIFRVPLLSAGHEDSWGVYVFRRFMAFGGEEALTPGQHVLGIEIRPYLDLPQPKTGPLIASGRLTLRMAEYTQTLSQADTLVQPIRTGSGWPMAAGRIDSARISALNAKIARGTYKEITSIIVIRDGKLVLEEYFNGMGRDSLMDTRSCGKTFTSALTGIAIGDGLLKNESMPLSAFYDLHQYAHYSSRKDSVRLRDLLTMSSAFDGSDNDDSSPGNEENMYPTPDWVKFALDLGMDSSKRNGAQWDYFTAGVVILGDVLNRRVPGGLESFADQKLMQPLGIRDYHWQYTPQHVPNTAGGIRLRSLDLARFGQLYKNGGVWQGKKILPAEWVRKSFTKQLLLPSGNVYPPRDANEGYGYLFWNKHYTIRGKRYETFYCSGNGGNKIFVFKDLPLVIVVTAMAYNRPYAHPQVDRMMEQYILPAVLP